VSQFARFEQPRRWRSGDERKDDEERSLRVAVGRFPRDARRLALPELTKHNVTSLGACFRKRKKDPEVAEENWRTTLFSAHIK
jgi:hypothetical protein